MIEPSATPRGAEIAFPLYVEPPHCVAVNASSSTRRGGWRLLTFSRRRICFYALGSRSELDRGTSVLYNEKKFTSQIKKCCNTTLAMNQNQSPTQDIGSTIRGYLPSLTPSEKKVGHFILNHIQDAVRMTLADVASESGVSDATVLRFCRSIGYQRWLEFKIELAQSLPHPSEQLLDEISEEDPAEVLAKKVFQSSIQALNDTSAVLDAGEFKKALTLISEAETIVIIGVGTSGPIAQEMYNRLFRLGLHCRVQTDSYLQVMEAALLTPQDVVIVISQSGDSTDPIRATATAKEQGCAVIAMTGNRGSALTEYADVLLLSVSHESRIESMSSRIAQYALTHALFMGLMMKDLDGAVAKDRLIWDAVMDQPFFQNKDI